MFWTRTSLDWPLLFWVVCAFASLLWAVNPAYSFKKIQGEVSTGVVVYYLLVYANQDQNNQNKLLLSLVISNLFSVLFAIWDFNQAGGSLDDYSIRARGLHENYPEFGTYLITVLPFLLVSFFPPLMKSVYWFLGILLSLNLFCIYITYGRAMWLAAAAELLVVGWIINKKNIFLVFLIGLLLLPLVIPKAVWFHGEVLPISWKNNSQKIGGTTGDLIDILELASKFALERPFQGIGYGRYSFSEAFPVFRANHQPLLWHAHNTFLDIFFQMGIQGLLIFIWLIGVVLFHTYRRGKSDLASYSGLLNLAVWVMVIGFFIRNSFDDLYVGDNLLLFWCLSGRGGFSSIQGRIIVSVLIL